MTLEGESSFPHKKNFPIQVLCLCVKGPGEGRKLKKMERIE